MSKDEAHQRAYEQWAAYCRRHEGGHPWGDHFQRWFDWRAAWWTVLMEAARLDERE